MAWLAQMYNIMIMGPSDVGKTMLAGWVKMLDDEVLATAILDPLLFRCEVISLTGKSYRMENRKTIFDS
jgi:DNA replication protein DnaC